MKFADLKGKPVVSMADGTKIGEIDDLVIDTTHWQVVELYVVGKPGRGLLSLSNVKGVGPDAVTIERADTVTYNTTAAGLCLASLKEMHVVDGSGTVRGHVGEVTFAPEGPIESLDVRQGGVLGIGVQHLTVAPVDIRGTGDKILTVDIPVVPDAP